ncbi:hypothetical protein [Streptomyces flavidovirens]|uniref:hypothetical protein n=1 Tax=Streptomyces flavidovirens TaxID=67298 RepID=UPI000410C168|nr:hypothetical protein [Streptomyces flavidovirens]
MTGLTMGGLALSLAILWANLRPWWKGSRDPKALIPFGSGFSLGALSTMCVGGILGFLAGRLVSIVNGAGDKVVGGTTGTGGSTISTGTLGTLTPEGAAVTFLITCGVFIAWKTAGKTDKRRYAGGAMCGVTLCLTAGIAGALAWVPDVINTAGIMLRTTVEGGGVL